MWQGGDPGETGYVWTDELGLPLRPDGVSRRFAKAQTGAGVRAIPLHGARHTAATLALAAGVPDHVVSERLGHASPSITSDIHAHVLKSQRSDAARQVGDQLYGTGTEGGPR